MLDVRVAGGVGETVLVAHLLAVGFGLRGAAFTLRNVSTCQKGCQQTTVQSDAVEEEHTSPDVPGLLLVVISPVPSSFRARRNSLLRSGPRRISFSRDGAMSMGGVVLEGSCGFQQKHVHLLPLTK